MCIRDRIDQDNDLIQANANNQEQTDNFNLALAGVGDPTAGETQEAELENEAEQENNAEINQAASASCEGYAVVCDNKAVNIANVDQDNDATQANANNQYSGNGGSGNTQDADSENEAEQENKAEINQVAYTSCEGYAVVCDNTAVNVANVDQDNDATQANANNQYSGGSGSGNTQEAELELSLIHI